MQLFTIEKRLKSAYEKFRMNDASLLELGAGERTIASRIAHYMIPLFPRHDVDIEYNRHGKASKEINWPGSCREGNKPRVMPDIVIHHRGRDEANLLVVEIKKADAAALEVNCDREKLAALRLQYGYAYSLLLIVPTRIDRDAQFEWNG